MSTKPSDLSNIQGPIRLLPLRVRHAEPEDAHDVYDLMVEAFGRASLPYTIYQAPQAVRYLEQLIAQSIESGHHRFVLVEDADRTIGYYHALVHDTEFFLNYIAVAERVRGLAWGSFLLEHYEQLGKSLGCRRLALHVFESNEAARDWYLRHGYRLCSTSYHARIGIGSLKGEGIPLDWDEESWMRARREEDLWGFSQFECVCGAGRLTVGLIAHTNCKLLHHEGVSIEEAALAVAHRFREQRDTLILSSVPEIPSDWPLKSSEKVLHLAKAVK